VEVKRPNFFELAPKYEQTGEVSVLMGSPVYQRFQKFSAPLMRSLRIGKRHQKVSKYFYAELKILD
jgi:hypothetical protein